MYVNPLSHEKELITKIDLFPKKEEEKIDLFEKKLRVG